MPRAQQIIPKYSYPHVGFYVNDNTVVSDTASTSTGTEVTYLSIFQGPEGIDNKLVNVPNVATKEFMFGTGGIGYGQPYMMTSAYLQSGNASVWCMRIMPDDALYAATALSVYYKADVAAKKFRLKFKAKSFAGADGIVSADDLVTKGQTLDGIPTPGSDVYVDSDGYTQVPYMTFRVIGRGTYGNTRRWRISRDIDMEAEYGIKMYNFQALDVANGLKDIAFYTGALVDSFKYSGATIKIDDVIDELDTTALAMDIRVYDTGTEALYAAYQTFVNDVITADSTIVVDMPDLDEFDPLFGYGVGNDVRDPFISFTETLTPDVDPLAPGYDAGDYTNDTDLIHVDNIEGNMMLGGSNGAFDDPDLSVRDLAIETAYIKAFNGTYDNTILSRTRVDITAMMDANYSYEVKKAMFALNEARFGGMLYLDTGIITSYSAAQKQRLIDEYDMFRIESVDPNTQPSSTHIETQWYTVKDPETRKKVNVTMTYLYAQILANHIIQNGSYTPFVGANCQLSGHVKNSLQPQINEYEGDLMDWLFINRFNYFKIVSENTFQRACQNTTQMLRTDLVEGNNMYTLFRIKKIVEFDANANLYNWANADDRERFSKYEKAKFADWAKREVESIDIRFDMNEYESARSIIHGYIDIVYRTLNTRATIEADINSRSLT